MLDKPKSYFSRNPKVMWGQVCIRGTRISVAFIKGRRRGGDTAEQIAKSYNQPIAVIRAAINYGLCKNPNRRSAMPNQHGIQLAERIRGKE